MPRYTNDILNVLGGTGIPDPSVGTNQDTYRVWGTDLRTLLLALDSEHSLKYEGDPNGHVRGFVGRKCWDTLNSKLWICTVAGTIGTSVWTDFSQSVADDVEGILLGDSVAYAIALGG